MLPAAGAVAAALAMAPHAEASGFFDAEPTSPTVVNTPLTWSFAATGGEQCDLSSDVGVSDSRPCDAGLYQYTPTTAGTYTLTVSDPSTTPAATLGTSAAVEVHPATPAPIRAGGSTSAPRWSFTLPSGATATCTVAQAGTTLTSATCADPFTTDLSADAYGTYDIGVVVHQGGLDSAQGTVSYTLRPPAPDVTLATPATTPGNDAQPTFTITDNAAGSGHTFACTVTGPNGFSTTLAGCDATAPMSVDLRGAPDDGVFTLHVLEAADGVAAATEGTAGYALDRQIRPVTVTVSPTGGGRTITGTVTEPDADGITYVCTVLELPALAPTACGASIRFDLPGSAGEGVYTVKVTAKDAVGNATSDTALYTLDVTGPKVAPTATATPASPGTSKHVTWTLQPAEPGETFICGATTTGASAVCSGATVGLTITGTDGSYSVTVHSFDSFGNAGVSFDLTYVLDTTPPAAPTTSGSTSRTGNLRSTQWSLADADQGGDLDHYRCTLVTPLGASAGVTCDVVTGQAVLTIGSASPDGTYIVDVYAVDALGNEATSPLVLSYLLDTQPPVAATVTPVPEPGSTGTTGSSRSPSWSVSNVEPGATVTCAAVGPAGALAAGKVTCNTSAVSLDLTGLVDGTYSVTVTVTDAAGNATSSAPVTYLLDTQPPAAVTVTPASGPGSTGTTGFSSSPSWSIGNVEPGAVVTCAASGPSGALAASKIACSGSSVTLNLSGLADGAYSITVTQTDAAGNATASPAVTYVFDTHAPATPTVTGVTGAGSTGATGYSRAPSWSISNVEPGATVSCAATGPAGALAPGRIACTVSGLSLDLSLLSDGTYQVTVTVTDAAGNANSATAAYVLDSKAPAAPTVTAMPGPGSTGTTGFSTSPSWSISNVEAGAGVSCAVTGPAGVVAANKVSCGTTSVTLNLSGLADGSYSVTVTVTDAAGNATSAPPTTYVLDTHAPATATLTAVTGPGDTGTTGFVRSPSWSISNVEPGTTVTCAATNPAGQPLAGARVTCGTSVGLDLAGLADGTYTVTVTITDAAGNATATVASYLLDTVAPAMPSVTPVVKPGSTGTTGFSRSPSWSVTGVEAGAVTTCVASGPGGTLPGSLVTCGPTVSLNLAGLSDGTYSVTVTVTDAAGNATSAAPVSYLLDTVAPPLASVTPVVKSGSTGMTGFSRSPSWSVTGVEAGAVTTCAASGPGGTLPGSLVTCGPTVSLNLAGLSDGTYSVTVTVTDAAGNATSSAAVTYLLDTDPPVAATVTPEPGPGSTGTTGYSTAPSWSVSDVEPGASISCSVTGPNGVVAAGFVSCGTTVALQLSSLPDGAYALTVTLTDAAGNATTAAAATYLLDRVPPPAPDVATGSTTPTGNAFTWTWSIADSDTRFGDYQCTVSGPAGSTAAVTCSTAGVVTLTIAAGSPDGSYDVSVWAVDAAGNVSQTPLALTYLLDTVAPARPMLTPVALPGSTGATGFSRTPSWTVSNVENAASYSCRVSGPGGVVAASAVTCGPTVTVNLAGLGDGTYLLTVTLTDAAGNAVDATPVSYVLDTSPPTAAVVTPVTGVGSTGTTGFSRSPSWSVTGIETGATISCEVTGPAGVLTSNRASCGTTVTLNLSGQPDGTYVLTVTVTDAAGNSTASRTVSYVLDTVAPPAPSRNGGTASPANTRTPSWPLVDADPTVTYTCQVTGPAGYSASVTCAGGSVGLTIGASSPDGTYDVTVNAVDPAGNVNASPLAFSYVLDTTGPLRPEPSTVTSPSKLRLVTWSLTGTEAGETYSCTVDGGASVACSGSSVQLSLAGRPDGAYTVTVTPLDRLGNPGVPLTLTYVLDTIGPAAPGVTVVGSPGASRSPTWTLTGSESPETYTCALTKGSRAIVTCSGSTVALSLGTAADGPYTVTVTPFDALGNPGSPITLTYVLDTTGPVAPSASTVASPDNRRSVRWSLTGSETGESYACTVTGLGASVSCDATGVTLSLAGANDGTYVVTVTPVDALGNRGVALVIDYTLDTTGPVQPRVTAAPASPAVSRSVNWSLTDAESPVTYQCQQSGPVSFAMSCGSSVSMTLPSNAPDGVYTVTVTPYDALLNAGRRLVLSYVLDTTAPAIPVASIISPGNDVTPTPSLVVEPGAVLTCSIQRFFLPVATVACGADGTVDLSAYGDGEYEISVAATDAAGNMSGFSAPYTYVLDTVAPPTPLLASPASPSPVVAPVWRWSAEADTTATCTISDAAGAIVTGPVTCTDLFTGQFAALPDGAYTLSVVLTDTAGNRSVPATSVFILDRTAPVPPTVVPPASPDNSRTPRWIITAPRGATLTCTLLRGRTVIMAPGACPAGGVVSLAGLPDGTYTMRVTATDSAGNVSAASVTTYVLDTAPPAPPTLGYGSPASGTSRTPFWGFSLPPGTTGRCELLQGGIVIASRSDCHGAVRFNISGPDGSYVVRIVAVDAAGNASEPLIVGYQLYGHGGSGGGSAGSSGPSAGPGNGGHKPTPSTPEPKPPTLQRIIDHLGGLSGQAAKVARKATNSVTSALPSLPVIHDPLTNNVSHAVQNVINAVSKAGGGTGFPLLLLIVVAIFLMAQSRVDRRDPKLALASVAADDNLQFGPPPSRGDA